MRRVSIFDGTEKLGDKIIHTFDRKPSLIHVNDYSDVIPHSESEKRIIYIEVFFAFLFATIATILWVSDFIDNAHACKALSLLPSPNKSM